MRNAFLLFAIVITSLTHTNAQNDNPCTQDWGKWLTVYSFAPGVDLQVSFKYQIKGRKGGDCGQSYYRFSKPIIKKGAHIEFKFDYRKKDGTIGTESFSFVELNKVGISEDNNSNFYQGYEMVRIYDAKLVDPERDKSVQLKTDINTAVQNYDQQYNEANTALGKVQDATKRNSLQTRLTNSRNSLLQNKAQAQQQLNSGDGDAMSQTLASIKQNRDDLKTIGLDIDFANKKLPTETKIPAPIKNNGTSDATGRRADNTGNGSQSQSAALTNGGTVNAQKQQYQQQANSYLNAADNSTGIEKAKNTNLALISATAAGNRAQAGQIQQQVNQQQAQNTTDLVNSTQQLAGTIVTLLSSHRSSVDIETIHMQALQGYIKDAEAGNVHAMVMAGLDYGLYKDYTNAVYWYAKAAQNGDEAGMYYLSRCYKRGQGVETNVTKATYWLEQAAERKDLRALMECGQNIDLFDYDKMLQYNLTLDSLDYIPVKKSGFKLNPSDIPKTQLSIANIYQIKYRSEHLKAYLLKTISYCNKGLETISKQKKDSSIPQLEKDERDIAKELTNLKQGAEENLKNITTLANNLGFSEGGANHPYIAVADNGAPYVIYSDCAHERKATVMKYDGLQWVVVGSAGFSETAVYDSYITISHGGMPYISFYSEADKKISVMKFDGKDWINITNTAHIGSFRLDDHDILYEMKLSNDKIGLIKFYGNTLDSLGYINLHTPSDRPALLIDHQGVPFIAYKEQNASGSKISVKKLEGNNWVKAGNDIQILYDFDMVSSNEGSVYIAGNNYKMNYIAKFDGTNWIPLVKNGIDNEASVRLAVSPTGIPWILHSAFNPGYVKLSIKQFTGRSWQGQDIGYTIDSGASLAIDNKAEVYVAYANFGNEGKVVVMKFDGKNWTDLH